MPPGHFGGVLKFLEGHLLGAITIRAFLVDPLGQQGSIVARGTVVRNAWQGFSILGSMLQSFWKTTLTSWRRQQDNGSNIEHDTNGYTRGMTYDTVHVLTDKRYHFTLQYLQAYSKRSSPRVGSHQEAALGS